MSDLSARAAAAILEVFGPARPVGEVTPIDGGRGVFSRVVRAELDGEPASVAVKLLRADANGAAALTSGAAARELLAYQAILSVTPSVAAPEFFGVSVDERHVPALVMADLSRLRHVDQIDGLTDADVRAVVAELAELHRAWAGRAELDVLDIRRCTPGLLPADGLERGAQRLDTTWSNVTPQRREALQALVSVRAQAVAAFAAEGDATVCHGDPRADNVVFTSTGRAVLMDWQQIAIQFGEADLAWLMATSIDPARRRTLDHDIAASYAIVRHQDAATTWRRYRLGMVLPGLAVLLLSQRVIDDDRTARFVEISLERIADCVLDLDVVELVSS